MADSARAPIVLVIEDGDEYFENLTRFVPGPRYLQAHAAAAALACLRRERVDLIYLDMRFDRIPRAALVGDHRALCDDHGGDAERAWRFLADHQGLYILAAVHDAGFASTPVLLAYDFSHEPQRWQHLQRKYPRLAWLGDATAGDAVRTAMATLLAGETAPQ